MKKVAVLLLLGYLRPAKGIQMNSKFVEDVQADAKTWLEISKSVREGDDMDGFTNIAP